MIIVHGLKEYVKFNKANWENIKSDIQKVLEKIKLKNNDTRNTVDTLWNNFKTELITSIEWPGSLIGKSHMIFSI
jgi:hypothetical protein